MEGREREDDEEVGNLDRDRDRRVVGDADGVTILVESKFEAGGTS